MASRIPRLPAWPDPPAARRNDGLVQKIGRGRQRHDECQLRRPPDGARTYELPGPNPASRASNRERRRCARRTPRTHEPRATDARAPEARPDSAPRASVLGPTLRFRGELSAQEDLIIQGSVEGSITHTQSLTVGTDGTHERRHSRARHRHRRQGRGRSVCHRVGEYPGDRQGQGQCVRAARRHHRRRLLPRPGRDAAIRVPPCRSTVRACGRRP